MEGVAGFRGFEDREATLDTDVLHNSLTIEAFPSTQTLAGTSVITVKSKIDGLTEFTFQLSNQLTPGQILVSGNPVGAPVATGTHSKRITLDRVYNANEEFTVTIPYAGAAPLGMSGMLWSSQDGQPVVSSFSEPFDAGTWWACKDGDVGLPGDNSDKATWELAVTHDAALTAVSNGTMLGIDDLSGGKVRTRWASNYPMSTYLSCFSLAKYNNWNPVYQGAAIGGVGTVNIPLRFYAFSSQDTPARRAAWEKVIPMLDVMRSLFGEYPFVNEGYGIYQFPFSGGMEHQTMSGQGNFAEGVTIHELGHQWWGNNVTCKTWHDLWLNEGFATYTEALWAERKTGTPIAANLQAFMVGNRPALSSVGGTVYVFDTLTETRLFDRDLTYLKGAWVLHMLRGLVGDEAFFNILVVWRAQYQGSAATTDDFQNIAEQVSGKNLDTFFEEWVYNGGAPTYAKGLQSFSLNGKNWTRFHVRQTQNPDWRVFTHPLTVRLFTTAGDVDWVVKPIARTSFFVRSSGTVGAADLFFDPDRWILNYGVAGEAPLQGPPVILSSEPVAGSMSVFASSPANVKLEFSEAVAVQASQFSVTRSNGEPVDFTLTYDAPTQMVTLAFASKLSPSIYSVSLLQSPHSQLSGQELDGDVFAPQDPASFPTGDGVAGTTGPGSTLLKFTVQPGSCPCDLDGSGSVDDSDFVRFAAAYNELLTMAADFNGDGVTDDGDFVIFAIAYDELLCP